MTIQFERPEFHASVADVRAAAADLTAARARASEEVDMLRDSWRGAAAHDFGEAWEDWLDASARVAGTLEQIAEALAGFKATLTTCDEQAASALAGRGRRLP